MNQIQVEVYENQSTICDIGRLIISLRSISLSLNCINVCVGRPGLPNAESEMSVGGAILFETHDEGIFEVRLLSMNYANRKADFLVSHVSPMPGLTAAFVETDPYNTPFTSEEKTKINECLAEVKENLLQSKYFNEQQNKLILIKLDEIAKASDRMGKKDWKNWLIGTLTAITVTASLSMEARKILFTSVGKSLAWLFQNTIQLLP